MVQFLKKSLYLLLFFTKVAFADGSHVDFAKIDFSKVGHEFADGVCQSLAENGSKAAKGINFASYIQSFFSSIFSGSSKALKGKDFNNLIDDSASTIPQIMNAASKQFRVGAKGSMKEITATMNETGKELGVGVTQFSDNLADAITELGKSDGKVAQASSALVKTFTRPVNEGIFDLVHKNALIGGSIFLGTFATYCVLKYGVPVAARMIERALMRPKLIIESSKKSLWQRVFGAYQAEKTMIFAPQLEERLQSIVQVTSAIQQHIQDGKENVKYRNLLLYGPPGTGKTMFAKELAKRCNMEYAFMSGSSFSKFKNGEDIEALDELFAWANKSKGLLIFIDEAESFLSERKNMDPQSPAYLRLTNFLNYTGQRSNKFMIVFATNHKDVLDSAMYRRIDDLVLVPLPEMDERIKILNLYQNTILLDAQCNDQKFIDSVKSVLTQKKIESIAALTEGLSGGELEGILNNIQTDANIRYPAVVTESLVDTVVQQAIEKYYAFNQKA